MYYDNVTLRRGQHFIFAYGYFYRPQRSCGQGNIFTPVCHSVHRGGVCLSACWDNTPQSRQPPWSRLPPRPDTPPGADTPPDLTDPPTGHLRPRKYFYTCLSFCSQGGSASVHAGITTPPEQTPLGADTPPGADTPRTRHPRSRHPPWT